MINEASKVIHAFELYDEVLSIHFLCSMESRAPQLNSCGGHDVSPWCLSISICLCLFSANISIASLCTKWIVERYTWRVLHVFWIMCLVVFCLPSYVNHPSADGSPIASNVALCPWYDAVDKRLLSLYLYWLLRICWPCDRVPYPCIWMSVVDIQMWHWVEMICKSKPDGTLRCKLNSVWLCVGCLGNIIGCNVYHS